MSEKYVIETLGSLIKATPKDDDYDYLVKILAPAIYSKIKSREFTLKRSAEHDNNSIRDTVYMDNLLVTVDPSELDGQLFEVTKSFQDNNMSGIELSNRVVKEVIGSDKKGGKFFNDVVPVLGYTSEGNPEYVDYLSKMDTPQVGRPIEVNFSFILEEDKDTFLERYNGDSNSNILIGGRVGKLIFLNEEQEGKDND